ncbi:hypothetical protein OROGR_013745 [Orobanche gracilis]
MAVIEEESSGENASKSRPNSWATSAPSGYGSDGYETASDTELNDSLSENDSGPGNPNDVSGARHGDDKMLRQ